MGGDSLSIKSKLISICTTLGIDNGGNKPIKAASMINK